MKKTLISLFIIILMSVTINAADYIDAPGGIITDTDSFIQALGGDEAAYYEDNNIILKSDIILKGSLNITAGEYVISGRGCVISRGFTDGAMISIKETKLIFGNSNGSDDHPSLTIDGNNSEYQSDCSALLINSNAVLDIYVGTLIKNNSSLGDGGAVYANESGTFNMYGGIITANTATGNGGGIASNNAFVTVYGGLISSNKAKLGGGIYLMGGETALVEPVVKENTAEYGGGVYSKGTLLLGGASIEYNKAVQGGGVFIAADNEFSMANGYIIYNDAQVGGGAYNDGTFNMLGGVIAANTAASGAGAVNNGLFNQSAGEITENTASGLAGGVINYGEYNLTAGSVSSNKSDGEVGGVANIGKFIMSNGSISSNKAENGTGVGMSNSGELTLSGNAFISFNNDVSLYENVVVTIIGDLTANPPIATFTPPVYKNGIKILSGDIEGTIENGILAISKDSKGGKWQYNANGEIERIRGFNMYIIVIVSACVAFAVIAVSVILYVQKKRVQTK